MMLDLLQRIGKALMLPIAILPAAALLLRFGQKDLLNLPFMAAAGNAVFANLPLIFAAGTAVGIAKDGNGAAALSGTVGYFVFTEGLKAIDKTANTAVLGGILAGVIAGLLYNKYHTMRLPEWLGFFSGRRFVPIATAVVMILMASLFGIIWPPIQTFIDGLGRKLLEAGPYGAGAFGLLNRALIPVGLHHVLNNLFWFVFGEYHGATGDLQRFFAGDPTAGRFMAGFFPIMMFGLPAAALAMFFAAQPHRRREVAGILASLALTSCLTGITEPLEFSFLFLCPLLYGVHAILTGTSLAIAAALGIRHGFGFSAGAIDFVLNFRLAEKPFELLGMGLVYGVLYFIVFSGLIRALDLKTPGREPQDEPVEEKSGTVGGNVAPVSLPSAPGPQPPSAVPSTGEPEDSRMAAARGIFASLGGRENLLTIESCATRLRLTVADPARVDDARLKKHGAKGVIRLGQNSIQVVMGTEVEFYADALKRLKG